MLLCLPPQVIRATCLTSLVDEILANDVSGLGGASVRAGGGMAGTVGRPGRPAGGASEDEDALQLYTVELRTYGRRALAFSLILW